MKFLVVGPGAMGCLFSSRLKRAGHEVVLLDYILERAQIIDRDGISVEGITGEYTVNVPTTTGEIPISPEFVLFCVKSNHTSVASEAIKSLINPDAVVVTLQNGIGNLEILVDLFGEDRVLGGVTAEGATLLGPGRIKHAGQGETIIGPGDDPGGPAYRLVEAFNQAGFQTRVVDDVNDLLWGKLIINVGINALSAITRLKNGQMTEQEGTNQILEDAVKEAVAVARAKKINLPYADPIGRVKEVCRLTAGNISSMLQDVLKEKITEIDFINGAIVREGKTLEIPTPVNSTLSCLVLTIQETYKERVGKQ